MPDEADNLAEYIQELHNTTLAPLNSRVLGPLQPYNEQTTPMPMVFILGNHSSGKSTFINHVVGKEIQTTGVAPTDDSFTVIAPGKEDVDQDGPALIGDPGMGFSALRTFGSGLISHVNLKVREDLDVTDIMLVDSPGMIDSPDSHQPHGHLSHWPHEHDRGYDFPGVVRWFADRADVILLFFDPDKPGTTGETLQVLTDSLLGVEHKVHIILNKVDQFRKVHDFARSYGSLCWNLSKVIKRKDLPRIYTMCAPAKASDSDVMRESVRDLDLAREEIVAEVRKAPLRRVDNNITRLDDAARLLRMHLTMCDHLRREYKSTRTKLAVMLGAGGLVGATLAGATIMTGLFEVGIPLAVCTTAGLGVGAFFGSRNLQAIVESQQLPQELDRAFRSVYSLQLAEGDDFVVSLWDRVRPALQLTLKEVGIANIKKPSSSDINNLESIIETEVPNLRRKVSKIASLMLDPTKDPKSS